MRSGTLRIALASAAFAVVGCAADETIVPIDVRPADDVSTYVGPLAGTDVVVAVSTDGDAIVAYVCGGPTSFATRTRWFRGVVDPASGVAHLVAVDGAQMDLIVAAERVHGEVDAADGRAVFDLDVAAGGALGLYSVVDQGCRTGVIVHGSVDAPAVQGAWCGVAADGRTVFSQVTPILPLALSAGALRVRVREGGVERILSVEAMDATVLR